MIARITNLVLYTALAVVAIVGNAHGTTLSASGTFTRDDDVATFTFDVAPGNPTQTVTLRTLSYAGGTNGAGQVIPSGGFDPIVTVLDRGLIQYREDADLGLCDGVRNAVSRDPVTNQCFDKVLVMNLIAGQYTVEITQFDNARIGPSYGFGFSRTDATFTSMFGCSAGQFCDKTGASRTGFWAADVTGVPTPAAAGLFPFALAALGWVRRKASV